LRPLIWLVGAAIVAVAFWQAVGAPALSSREGGSLPPGAGEPVTVVVEQGEDAGSIAQKLARAEVIGSARRFRALVVLQGYGGKLRAGEYELEKGMPVALVIERLVGGLTKAFKVTVPEGIRVEQVAELLERKGVVKAQEFLEALDPSLYQSALLEGMPSGLGLEGYLFPDTYFFSSRATAQEVVAAMLADLEARFSADLRQEAAGEGLSIHEVLTLASIVEREAALPQEMPTIASVFRNRIALGMRLDADPTIQYALANDPVQLAQHGYWKRELAEQDTAVVSPYNTYKRVGLPPGPIAGMGLTAIEAVVRPAQTNYLYFVAKGDGGHAFATTLEEHVANVRRYMGDGGP